MTWAIFAGMKNNIILKFCGHNIPKTKEIGETSKRKEVPFGWHGKRLRDKIK
jgi:hypothetical protein